MIDRPWRCFWAVPLPERLRESLAVAVAEMRADPLADAAWRWVDSAGWHVTLAFLDGVAPDSVRGLLASVSEEVRDEPVFSVDSGGLGGFPSGRRARVLWYGVSDADGRLQALAARVARASGLPQEAPFRAHVTLARSRDRSGAHAPAPPAGGLPIGSVDVRDITLYRSHLGHGPARYEALGTVPLAAPAPVPAR
jgi:2'-5' RNA ligase